MFCCACSIKVAIVQVLQSKLHHKIVLDVFWQINLFDCSLIMICKSQYKQAILIHKVWLGITERALNIMDFLLQP